MNISKELFGQMKDGKNVLLFTLTNNQNMTVKIINYGGIITSIQVPDKNGKIDDVVLGFSSLKDYLAPHPYFGAIIGRYGNRIANGKFTLKGVEYKLAVNDGENHLHGGITGFDKVLWDATEIKNANEVGLSLTYLSTDMEEGYPGNLRTTVEYLINDQNELIIRYQAVTDKTTVVNLTNHSYFNLQGEGVGNIMNHHVTINADGITAVNSSLIPTGEIPTVKGTPMDFIAPQAVGSRISDVPGGYDHNYVLNKKPNELSFTAKVFEPVSGRIMEVSTTEPAVQFYTGNFLDGTLVGKSGKNYPKHAGFCLETQHFPDSPNQPAFPSTVLNPGEIYHHLTVYKFSV